MIKCKINFEPNLVLEFMQYLSLSTLRTQWSLLFNAKRNEAPEHAMKGLKVKLKPESWFELSNIYDDCTDGGSNMQPCDAALHELTAYKSAPNDKNFKM